MSSKQKTPGFYGFNVGNLKLYALHEGWLSRDRPAGFVTNAKEEDVRQAFAEIGLPADKLTLTFTTLLIDSGDQKILIDTGLGTTGPATTGKTVENLAAAGYDVGDIDTILISHFHGDHIAGLVNPDGKARFPKAKVLVPRVEWDYWMSEANAKSAEARLQPNFGAVAKIFASPPFSVSKFEWGANVLPFVKALQADGHTPGQTAFDITSNGERLLFVADITNNPLIFARYPHWIAAFDVDPDRLVATRTKFFEAASAERTRLFFFHAPFPAIGYISKTTNGYDYFPELWRSAE